MKLLVLLACLATIVFSIHPDRVHVSKSCDASRHTCMVSHWRQMARPSAAHIISPVFAVKQANERVMDVMFNAVSDPKSASYGQYLSFEEIGQLTKSAESVEALEKWLGEQNINFETSLNGDFIRTSMSVEEAEKLFDTHFYHFESKVNSNKKIIRTHEVSLPSHIAPHVDFISHTTRFPTAHRRAPIISHSNNDVAGGFIDPQMLLKFLGIKDPKITNQGATQSVFESLGEYYSESDLASFQKQWKLPRLKMARVIGPNNASKPGGEATLDVQYMMALAQGPTTFWSIPPKDDVEPFLQWIVDVSNDPNAPLVHSVSYGDVEDDSAATENNRFNKEVQKLGLRGISVVISSGDDGVANFPARANKSACGFFPSYPASSPYVTAVGATQGPEVGKPSIACTSDAGGVITTGGGFSTIFARPSYQQNVVNSYLSGRNVPPKRLFASTGRGYPDVSMPGYNYIITQGGESQFVSGTSASAPVFGAFITLLNNARMNAGKPPMGFINPFLYQLYESNPDAYVDVVKGRNNCCAEAEPPKKTVCCKYGFSSSRGWDPVTGFGSPRDLATFLNAALA